MTTANEKKAASNAAVDAGLVAANAALAKAKANAKQVDCDMERMLRLYGYAKTVAGFREKYLREQKLNLSRYMLLMASAKRIDDQMRSGHPPSLPED